jgi:DNA modification methylase
VWGLRDYGTAKWEGGKQDCDHQVGRFEYHASDKQKSNSGSASHQAKNVCPKCGAVRIDNQIGLEKTPQEYVDKLVEVFHEVRRVLKKTGTIWLNLGDSYAGGGGISGVPEDWNSISTSNRGKYANENDPKRNAKALGLKTKDLIGIPWKTAFALQKDGWWLRQDIIWSKPNPMPESVTDRCTKSHEYIFLLTKNKDYYYDAEAIKEPNQSSYTGGNRIDRETPNIKGLRRCPDVYNPSGRNKRSVWTITTKPFKDSHFATFPLDLIRPMILAGTSEKGVCPDCGKPWTRIIKKPEMLPVESSDKDRFGNGSAGVHRKVGQKYQDWRTDNPDITIGWQPSCECNKDPIPAIVLDPFCGSGTACLVAKKLGRSYIGFDLNPDYVKMANNAILCDRDTHVMNTLRLIDNGKQKRLDL